MKLRSEFMVGGSGMGWEKRPTGNTTKCGENTAVGKKQNKTQVNCMWICGSTTCSTNTTKLLRCWIRFSHVDSDKKV